MKELVEINIGNETFSGWDDFSFNSGIDKTASSFSVSTTRSPLSLLPPSVSNNQITVTSNGDLLMTGHIETYNGNLDVEGGRSLTLGGRSITSTIVDSDTTGHFVGLNELQIIKKLVGEFGIEVETNITDWITPKSYTVESGSKVKDAIFHVLRMQKATVTVTPAGKLRIWQSKDRTSQGGVSTANRIKSASLTIDETKRFSEYQAKGQDAANFEGLQASEIIGFARDTTSRLRRRIFFPEPLSTSKGLRDAAEKAARRSFGAARSLSLVVSGWRAESGKFWTPGESLWVDLPEYDLSREMLIGDVAFTKSIDQGTLATLSMKSIDAHSSGAEQAPKRASATTATASTTTEESAPSASTGGSIGVHETLITGGAS